MGLERRSLGGFLGGLNLVDNPYDLKNGEAAFALNVDIGARDALSTRKGFSAANLSGTVSSQVKSPTVVASTDFSGEQPGSAWVGPNNVKASDNAYATSGGLGPTKRLGLTGFGFALPAGAIPVGVKLRVEKKASLKPDPKNMFDSAKLLIGGVAAGATRGGAVYTEADAYDERGGSEDLWGNLPTKAQAEAANFGVEFYVLCFAEKEEACTAFIDHIEMTVYYLVEGSGADAADHARPWYSGANRRLIMSMNGKIKSLKESVITELFAGTAGTTWCFEQMEYNSGGYKDSLWMMNGTDAAKKWDGTTFANWAGKPPKGNMLRVWKNMMIVSGVAAFPQRVFFSDVGNPESPEDETNGGYGNRWIDIRTSEDDLDPVTWMEIVDDVLLIFKKRSVNAIFDPSTFSFQRIGNVGCGGRFQSCVVDSRGYFINRAGIYSVTAAGELRYESLNLEPMFRGEGPQALKSLDLKLLESSSKMCALPNGRIYAIVSQPGAVAYQSLLLEGYPRLRGLVDRKDPRTPWVPHNFSGRIIKCLAPFRTKDDEVDKLIAGLTYVGAPELVQLFQGNRDGILAIPWQWTTGKKGFLTEEPFERLRRVDLVMKGLIGVTVVSYTDATASGYDGGFAWLETAKEGAELEFKRMRPETRGRYHEFTFSGQAEKPVEIHATEVALRGGKEH